MGKEAATYKPKPAYTRVANHRPSVGKLAPDKIKARILADIAKTDGYRRVSKTPHPATGQSMPCGAVILATDGHRAIVGDSGAYESVGACKLDIPREPGVKSGYRSVMAGRELGQRLLEVATCADKRSNRVGVQFRPGGLRLSASIEGVDGQGGDGAAVEAQADVSTTAHTIGGTFGINWKYLRPMLSDKLDVRVGFKDGESPVVFDYPGADWYYVVMPMQ